MMTRLTGLSKFMISAIVLGSCVTAYRTYGSRAMPPIRTAASDPTRAGAPAHPVRVGLSQWPGHMALLVGAGGLKTQPGSPADTEHLDLEIEFIEDAPAKNKALQTGEVDFVWQTVDELPISLGGYRAAKVDVVALLQIDWSRGGDACISSKEVVKVEDILGKKAATLMFSPDHTVFEFMITNSSLTPDQVRDVRKATQFSTDDFTFARTLFTKGKIEVACLWEPDVTLALAGRAGSHRLFSTADATELVADVLLVRKDYLESHMDVAEKLAKTWFAAVDIAERDKPAAARLISTVASRFRDELGYEKTLAALEWAKWTTLGDNVRFFGLDGSSPAFDRVYNQADGIWINYPEAEIKDRFAPMILRDDRVVRKIWEARGKPAITKAESYEARTALSGTPVFTKPVSINFATASNELTTEAIAAVNQQILPQIEIAHGMSIRIEGNTDYIGDRTMNQRLSELRAQAILEYLVTRGVPRERMVARGNGMMNPIASNTTPEGRAVNRRTDVLFIRNTKVGP